MSLINGIIFSEQWVIKPKKAHVTVVVKSDNPLINRASKRLTKHKNVS